MGKLLSVCMIVKNEEKVLERCLESIHGIADEIIVVDTGSTDSTKDIALKYTEHVYDFEWVRDFAKARNFAASKASGEWILSMDADEYVDRDSFEKFKQELDNNPPEEDINAVQIVNFVGDKADSTVLNRHTRFYRNNGNIEYERPIHEVLTYKFDENKKNYGLVNLLVYHTGYMKDVDKEKQKTERNLSILLEQKEKKGIDYFYIGNEYNKLGEIDKAIRYYQLSYNNRESVAADYITKLLVFLIDALYREKRYDEALEIIKGCEEGYPNYADYKYYKGLIYLTKKDYKKAKSIFENILANSTNLIIDHSEEYKEYGPLIHLANIYEKENNLQKAVEYYARAVSVNPSNDSIWSRLLYLLGKNSPLEELTGFINRKVVPSSGMNEQRMIKILLNVPILNVQKLSRSLLDNEKLSDLENESLLIKNYMLDLNFAEVDYLLQDKSASDLTMLMQTNIYSISDFIIQVHENENEKLFESLKKITVLFNINNIVPLLFAERHKKMKLNNTEKNIFVNIYRQAKILGIEQIMDKLDKKLFLLNKSLREEVKSIRNL